MYLVVLFSFTVAGIIDDWNKKNTPGVAASIISCCFLFVFVIGFFNEEWVAKFGWILVPMLIYSLLWEFYASVQETGEAEKEINTFDDLSPEEKNFLLNLAIFANALIVVPGYVLGIKLCIDIFL